MSRSSLAGPYNLEIIEQTYQRWRRNPASVDDSWRLFFEGFELGQSRSAEPSAQAQLIRQQIGVVRIIDAYRRLGHALAQLDPLSDPPPSHPLLELSNFGLQESDLDRTFDTSHFYGLPRATLRQLLAALRDTYCRTIGVEYMHIQDTRIRRWLQERMEPRRNRPNYDRARKVNLLRQL